tara:strand:- start:11623 stop:15630 length:4008 start_codon:yes stop_codon:yes gene_type:complete
MASKKIEAAEIIIKTTDGGSFKVTGKEAEKLTKKMKGLGGASQETDRRIKGVTQQSSNATKNFSKQAQTMQGGLVAVYATIAAQIFAVSAAFQFLKSSMETRNLIEGQKAFGSVTGTAYKSVTTGIQEATQGMLSFKAAASSAAIGVAAGLSAGQLESLGNAATNASLALGRDLEDSFNRLIRGVTKAEPELLDELGIILRLENATNKYAVSVGKTREQLNAYERTQAVLNDVLEQAETKYGKIQEKMDPDAFAMGQFSKEMDDLLLGFQEFVMKGIVPLLNFFKDNTGALIAAVGLFITPIIKSLLPDLNAALDNSKTKFSTAFSQMKTDASEARDAMSGIGQAFGSGDQPSAAESKKGLQDLGVKSFKQDDGKGLNKRQIAAYRRMMREKKGIYMRMNAQERRAFKNHLNIQEAMLKGSTQKQIATVQLAENTKRAAYKVTQTVYQGTLVAMRAATTAAAWAMNKAMMAAGIIGIIFMIIQGISALIGFFRDLDETAKKMRKETEDLTDSLKTLNEELDRMVDIRLNENLLDLKMSVEQAGQAFQSVDLAKQIRAYNKELDKGAKPNSKVMKQFQELAKNVSAFSPAFKDMAKAMEEGRYITEEEAASFKSMTTEIINASEASKRFAQNQETVNKALDKQIRKFKDVPYKDIVDAYSASIRDINLMLGQMEVDAPDRQFQGFLRASEIKSTQFDYSKGKTQDLRDRSAYTKQYDSHDATLHLKKEGAQYYNADGSLKNEEQINTLVEASNLRRKDKSNVMRLLKEQISLEKELAEIKAQPGLDEEEMKALRNRAEIQTRMRDRALSIQAAGIAQQKKELENQRDIAEAQEKGFNAVNQEATIKAQIEALGDRAAKLAVEKQSAELGAYSIIEKQLQQIYSAAKDEKTRLQLEEMYRQKEEESLKDYIKRLGLSGQELENMVSAVNNADIQISQEEALAKIKERKLTLAKDLLVNQEAVTKATQEQAQAARNVAILTATAARFAKLQQGSAGKQIARTFKKAQNLTNINAKTGMADALKSQMGDITGIDRTGMGEMELFTDPNTEAEKKYNELLSKRMQLLNEIYVLNQKNLTIADMEAGLHIMAKSDAMKETAEFQREQVFSLNPATAQFNQLMLEAKKNNIELTDTQIQQLKEEAIATESLKIETELMSGITQTLSNGFVSMFQTMVDGTKSFKEGMKDLTKSVLTDLAAMFAKAAALKIMLAMFPGMGNMLEGMSSIPGMGRYGGEMTKYRGGGVADGPNSGYMAMLHGREAVVPLGNDRSIPVDMRGMGGTGNQVTVNITMNGQGQGTSQVTGDGMQGLGRSIGNMVQQHLQQEMRPGGLLNQQGTKGRA